MHDREAPWPQSDASTRSTPDQTPRRRIPHAERHLQLLDAGSAIIRQDGVGALTMSRLADAVGVTKPIVYKHFRNSDDVIIAILDRYAQGSVEAVRGHIRGVSTIQDLMDGIIAGLFEYIRAEGSVIRSITNGFSFSDDVNKCFLELQDRSHRVYRHLLLQQGVSERQANIAAYALMEMINSTILEFAPDSTAEDEDMLKEMVRSALGVLVKDQRARPGIPDHILHPQG